MASGILSLSQAMPEKFLPVDTIQYKIRAYEGRTSHFSSVRFSIVSTMSFSVA